MIDLNTLTPTTRQQRTELEIERRVYAEIAARGGFLTKDDVAALAKLARTRLNAALVRCGGGRFTCPMQDVQHFIDIITRDGDDYVRDVSLPATGGR